MVNSSDSEVELEKLVFGDAQGFRKNLHAVSQQLAKSATSHTKASLRTANCHNENTSLNTPNNKLFRDLENLDNNSLFFIDNGSTDTPPNNLPSLPIDGHDNTLSSTSDTESAAWSDSDDDNLNVSLTSHTRLRKLRLTPHDDLVDGKEYSQRLQSYFKRVNPTPQWAEQSLQIDESDHNCTNSDTDSINSTIHQSSTPSSLKALLKSASFCSTTFRHRPAKLAPQVLHVQRMKSINLPAKAAAAGISSLIVHPTLPVLLTCTPTGFVYLHHLFGHEQDSHSHALLASLHVKGVSLTSAAYISSNFQTKSITTSPDQVLLTSRRRFFHIWNLQTGRVLRITRIHGHQDEQRSMEFAKPSPCGRFIALRGTSKKGSSGVVNILNAKTSLWRCQIRVNSPQGVSDFAWWSNGNGLSILGRNGDITEWDLTEDRVLAVWHDQGAVGATTLALSGSPCFRTSDPLHVLNSPDYRLSIGADRWIAVGSQTGIVNVYDRREWVKSFYANLSLPENNRQVNSPIIPVHPVPVKVLENLVTSISFLSFSPDAQLLAVASRWKRDALRIIHMATCSVYRNWPTSATPIGRVSSLTWSILKPPSDVQVNKSKAHPKPPPRSLVLIIANYRGKINVWEIL